MNIYSKNVRRHRNSLSITAQILCYSNFVLYKNKDKYSISSAELIEPFLNIKNSIQKLTYAAHFVKLWKMSSRKIKLLVILLSYF